ncbi:MAG: hypothetical protein V3T40_04325 [Nitrososphaerales archaeon]
MLKDRHMYLKWNDFVMRLPIIAVVVAASLFVNLAYVNVNAQKIDVMLDIFNKKFDTTNFY